MPQNQQINHLYIWAPTVAILAPINVWAAYSFSAKLLLQGYFVLFASMMNCLAGAILVAGLLLPPISVAYWIFEKYQEPIVV